MTVSRRFAASVVAAALAAPLTPALAEVVEFYQPATTYYYAPGTTYYYTPAPTEYYYVPATTETYYAPPITVTAPRASRDELITYDVVDSLASDPRLTGRIGVETFRNEVTLTGRVSTPGQVDIAARDARNVDGVRDVRNYLRPRVGG